MEKERERKDAEQKSSNPENYTIFDALLEAMAKKERKDSGLRSFLRKLRLSK